MGLRQEIEQMGKVKVVLEFISMQKKEEKIGLLYNQFCKEKGEYVPYSYKTFQRIIEELAERELIIVKKIIGGAYGSTRIISKK